MKFKRLFFSALALICLFIPFSAHADDIHSVQTVYCYPEGDITGIIDITFQDQFGNMIPDLEDQKVNWINTISSLPDEDLHFEIYNCEIRGGSVWGGFNPSLFGMSKGLRYTMFFEDIVVNSVLYKFEPCVLTYTPDVWINCYINDVATHQYNLDAPEDQYNEWQLEAFFAPWMDTVEKNFDVQIGNIYISNPNANVQIDPIIHFENGTGYLSIYSDQPTEIYLSNFEIIDVEKIFPDANVNFRCSSINGSDPKFNIYRVGPESIKMYIGSLGMHVDSKWTRIDSAPYIKNSRTYVPIRVLAEAFGADVQWDNASQTITIDMNGKNIIMRIGATTYWVNGSRHYMDVAPEISGIGRTFVPVRFVAEELDFKVSPQYDWNGATSAVFFYKI